MQTQPLADDFQDRLDQAMASTLGSLESLHHQITSLSWVALQNRSALDLPIARHGGACVVPEEERCSWVSKLG